MEVEHKVDSEDLVHCDLMAICSFIGGVLMKGLQFRQARAVVEKIGRWGQHIVADCVMELGGGVTFKNT